MERITPGSELFRRLTELLRQRIGLNPDSVGKQTLEHAVSHRLKTLRLANADDYVKRLAIDAAEWHEFLEEIIVPESWFFRELTPFKCVRAFAGQALNRETRLKKLRFLSIPCSRGEEPYSLAMTLLDAGLVSTQFEIIACDLSPRSLDYARRGRYRSVAFREVDAVSQRLTQQYFQPLGEEWELRASIRAAVKFHQANLAGVESLAGLGKFDFIFCRNVLIYLTAEVRQRALASFKGMLLPGGLLYLGHSECRLGPQAGARVWRDEFPAAFTWSECSNAPGILRRTDIAANPVPGRVSVPARETVTSSAPVRAIEITSPTLIDMVRSGPTPEADQLSRARHLANSGKLDEAESLCQLMLSRQATSADVYCLLGVIVQARGDQAQAEHHFQRSLFLQPDHYETLTHLLLLAQLRGDSTNVTNYQRRLNKLTVTSPGAAGGGDL